MVSMRTKFIGAWIGCTAAILTLMAGGSWAPRPPQAEKQQDAGKKQSGAKAKEREMVQPKQSASIPDQEPVLTAQHGFKELGKDFLLDQKQIWTSPDRVRFSDVQWLVPLSGITPGLMVTDRDFTPHLSRHRNTLTRY